MLSEANKWFLIFIPIQWLTEFGHGMLNTVVGPTQPYLAQNVGVDISTINLVWTFGFFGYLVGSFTTGFIFKRFLTKTAHKLMYLAGTACTMGLLMTVLPFLNNFVALVLLRCAQFFAVGSFNTSDASLLVFTMGPVKSRPFTMTLHALIGAGFFAATFLVRPFLPESNEGQNVCPGTTEHNNFSKILEHNTTANATVAPSEVVNVGTIAGISKIAWPFLIVGLWCVVFSIGFAILACLPYKMPRFYEEDEEGIKVEKKEGHTDVKYWKVLLFLVFLYYFVSCGIERIYQPMAYTFGICGPLKLSPGAAVLIDSSYNGGFMAGRIVSTFVAKLIKPRNMIIMSLVTCVGASIVLSIFATSSVIALYIGTCALGFFVSWQFGAGYSWLAKKMDITGRISSIFFIGCGVGSLATPPVSGFLFTSSLGPMSIIYMTSALCVLQCILFAIMWFLSRIKTQGEADVVPIQLSLLKP